MRAAGGLPIARALVLVALSLVAAGCLAPGGAIEPLASPQQVLPHLDLSDAHDHKDPAAHAISWNLELLGYDPVAPDTTKLGRYNHVNVQGSRAYVSAYRLANGTAAGLAIYNVSGDDPVQMALLETPDLTPIDVHGTPDGRYVVLAGHRDERAKLPVPPQPCTGTPVLEVCTPFVAAGVLLVDVSDESAPKVVASWTSEPSGAHTAKIVPYGDAYYVFIASYGVSYASRLASHVEILRVDEGPLGTQLTPVAEFFPSTMSNGYGAVRTFVHDMFVEEHPVTGQTLMWIAYWDGGVVVVDVSDPSRPQEIADWTDFDAVQYGNVHFVRPVGMIGERHITYAAPEYASAEHAGEAYVLDTTDPAAPQLLAKWVLPGDPVNDGGYRFSPHNFDPRGTKLVYAHYHGGVWVLDISAPETPVVEGYVFPTVPVGEPAFHATEDAPNVWAAVWDARGTIWASDIGTGLYHYRLVSDEPGTPPYEAVLAGDS